MKYLLILLTFGFLFQCTSFNKGMGSADWEDAEYGDTLSLHYGASEVGKAVIKQGVIAYGYGDQEIVNTLIEEITFRDHRYRFEFEMAGGIHEIKVLRYQRNSDSTFYPNDSYSLMKDASGVYRKYYGRDGEEVIREVHVTDPRLVANTEELFRYCNSYLSSYFMMLDDKRARYLRGNKIQSLGYELLKFERI